MPTGIRKKLEKNGEIIADQRQKLLFWVAISSGPNRITKEGFAKKGIRP
jgi:hypothetical protein